MQILLANAKLMRDSQTLPSPPSKGGREMSVPRFQDVADRLAAEMARMDVEELARQLDCNRSLALENWRRYQKFPVAQKMPALSAYAGQAYKHLRADSLTPEAWEFGQKHLWITCFLYGLLRPLDGIVPYRMEHCVTLEATGDRPVNQYWKTPSIPLKGGSNPTDVLIDSVKADDGVLVHLSTEEYEHLFDWKRVKREVRVVQPLFFMRQPNGSLKMVTVWAKSCRGAMVRYILQNQLTNPEDLQGFYHEGFAYCSDLGSEEIPYFVRELD